MSEPPHREWDRLEVGPPPPPPEPEPPAHARGRTLVLASWADLALTLGGCAVTLAAVRVSGYPTGLGAVPWALVMATAWWLSAAVVLLAVRRGTPGMLLVGLTFAQGVPGTRLTRTAVTALASALLLGLPALAGGERPLLVRAAGSGLEEDEAGIRRDVA